MTTSKRVINVPFVKGLEGGGQLSISKPLDIVVDTDVPNISFFALFVQDVDSEKLLTGGRLTDYNSGSERPVTIQEAAAHFNDGAKVGSKAKACMLIVDLKRQVRFFDGVEYTLSA